MRAGELDEQTAEYACSPTRSHAHAGRHRAPATRLTGTPGPSPTARDRLRVYLISPAVSCTVPVRISKVTLLTRTKIRRSTNPMRSRTSPNDATTPPRPKP
jgi:hypothetical protein